MTTAARAAAIVAALSTEDKIRLVSGKDFWTTESVDATDTTEAVPSIMVTDGPHGLRKQSGATDHVGLGHSVPATCFPPAAALGSTWDPELVEQVGAALGRESRFENVSVLLGPGLNIKRHPAGGRTFEYMSEDPFVAGKMSAALVRGIQSEGVGACLKHYAVNNQENNRMMVDAIVDERTLREIYLTGFEIAVKESAPWTVMCSYNQVNGTHAGEHRTLLTEILRDEWGFDGLVMTDWLATFDRPLAIHAGLDLEMPGSEGTWDGLVAAALEDGSLAMADLDKAATNVVRLALRGTEHDGYTGDAADAPVDFEAHHTLARRAAAAGTVLLTNDGILPLARAGSIALIGAFAESPRYQGGGSSHVNPYRLDNALDALREALGGDATLTYAAGYDATTGDTTTELMAEATAAAASADVVVLIAGLPSTMESEGYDRADLKLPAAHDQLVDALTAANPRTVVVLQNGAPVDLPWADKPAALVEAYLGGQAGGSAIADVLLGNAEPGGRLSESFPVAVEDLPSALNFPGAETQVEYREGLYVGYRFHDASGVAPRFPFGHGLSYTTFEYSGLSVVPSGDGFSVSVTVTNTGSRDGSEVVQVYVHDVESSVYRPVKELRGFAKVTVGSGQSATVTVQLSRRAFAFYDVTAAGWAVEAGDFEIQVGASSADIRLSQVVAVASDDAVNPAASLAGFVATDAEFAELLGREVPTPRPVLPFHLDSTVSHLAATPKGKALQDEWLAAVAVSFNITEDTPPEEAEFMKSILAHMPLRGIAMTSGGQLSLEMLNQTIADLNSE